MPAWKVGEEDLFIPLDKLSSTECPEARPELAEKPVGRIRAVGNARFLGRHSRDPLCVGGCVALCLRPLRVPLARLCPAGFPALPHCLQTLAFPCPPVVLRRNGCAERASTDTSCRDPASPAREVTFSGVQTKAAELREVQCLVPKAEHHRGWQSLNPVPCPCFCPARSREFRYLSPAWPCCPGLLQNVI